MVPILPYFFQLLGRAEVCKFLVPYDFAKSEWDWFYDEIKKMSNIGYYDTQIATERTEVLKRNGLYNASIVIVVLVKLVEDSLNQHFSIRQKDLNKKP